MFCLHIGREEQNLPPVSKAEHTLVSVGLSISATDWMVVPWTRVLPILVTVRLGKTDIKASYTIWNRFLFSFWRILAYTEKRCPMGGGVIWSFYVLNINIFMFLWESITWGLAPAAWQELWCQNIFVPHSGDSKSPWRAMQTEMVRGGHHQGFCAAEPAASRAPQLWERPLLSAGTPEPGQAQTPSVGPAALGKGRPGWRQEGQWGRRHSPRSGPWRRDTRGALWRVSSINGAWSRTDPPVPHGTRPGCYRHLLTSLCPLPGHLGQQLSDTGIPRSAAVPFWSRAPHDQPPSRSRPDQLPSSPILCRLPALPLDGWCPPLAKIPPLRRSISRGTAPL